jgi:aryl-alcohol dehydrogenase-like predicted oxidoreductase
LIYSTLGNSSIKVSKIGLGLWQASDEWNGSDNEIIHAVLKSHELGVNLVDTAEVYGKGHSEIVLGQALKKSKREEFLVATKVHGANLRYDELQRACQASLKRLSVEEIDLYQVHWPDPWEQIPLKYTMSALEKLYNEGKIRAIGASNFAVRDLEEARSLLSRTDIVSNQVRYNLLQREIEEEVLPYCKKENITILAWSPLAQGALTGKYRPGKVPKGDVRESNKLFAPPNLVQIEKLIVVLSRIAQQHHCTISQLALNWLAQNPSVIPIPGAKTPAQAGENAKSVEVKLSKGELDEIDRASKAVKIDYLPQTEPTKTIEAAA